MRIFSSTTGLLGVDIGTRAVKMLQVRAAGARLQVIGAGRIDAPEGAAPGWNPEPRQWLAAFSAGGFTGRRCVVCLPRTDVHVQPVRLPAMPERELRQAAGWEAAARFNLAREAMEVDSIATGTVTQGGEAREETLLIAASHQAINARLEPLMAAGLRPVAIDTDFAALARLVTRLLRRQADQENVQAVVEIGAAGSSLMILRGQDIAFYKRLTTGGTDLNTAVTEHLQISAEDAAQLRIARIGGRAAPDGASALDAATDRAVYEAVRPLLNDLVKEVVLCLRYYGVTFRGRPPKTMLLAGGDGLEPRLDELLANACKLPVVTDDESRTMALLAQQIESTLHRAPGPSAAWSTAAGLSLRGLTARIAPTRGEAAGAAAGAAATGAPR